LGHTDADTHQRRHQHRRQSISHLLNTFRPADVDGDGYLHFNGHAHGDGDPDLDPDPHPDFNGDGDPDENPHPDQNPDTPAHLNLYAGAAADEYVSPVNRDAGASTTAYGDENQNAHPHADDHAWPLADAHQYADTDEYGNEYADEHTDEYTDEHADADRHADEHAQPNPGCLSRTWAFDGRRL